MKHNIIRLFTVLVLISGLLLSTKETKAQLNVEDSCISAFILYAAYAYQIPGGDMAERYGHNSTIGPGLIYKTNKNWLWTAEMNFIFGSDTKNADLIISQLTADEGFVIGLDGTFVNIRPQERGFTLFGKVGKVLPIFKMNPNSGLAINFGIGYIQHKIKWDVEGNSAPQLGGDYKKGYDRFTEGISFSQSIGLFHMADKRLYNFTISAEIIESFTKTKRYNFDTYGGEPDGRLDLFYGLKVSWMIPLYGRAPKAMYYY